MSSSELIIKELQFSYFDAFMHHVKMHTSVSQMSNDPNDFKNIILTAEKNSVSVGGISGWKNYDFAYIEIVWVDHKYQKNKIGSRLVEIFTEKCLDLNCSVIITTANNYSESQGFWLKCGFKIFHQLNTKKSKIIYFKKDL